MTLRRFDKGFTLIEIVTVIVVLGILGAFTFTFIDNAIKTYMIADKQRNLYQEASYIMERITRELRDAQSVSIDSGTGGLIINKASHPANSLVMDSSSNVIFYRNANREMIRNSTFAPNVLIGKNIDSFSPTLSSCSSGTANCTVAITLQLTDSGIPVVLTTTISPKNIVSSTDLYSGRCFNGDYEDVIQ